MIEMKRSMNYRFVHQVLTLALLSFACISCEDLLSNLNQDARSRLIDAWKVDESGSSYKSGLEIYWVEISKHPTDSARILISNFYNVGGQSSAKATLAGRALTLPLQTLTGGFSISGSAEIQEDWNKITWTYSVDDGSGIPDGITAVYTRLE